MSGFIASHLVLAFVLGQAGDFMIASSVFGETYVSSVSEETLHGTPTWNDDDANPPVSARSAMNLARIMRDSIAELPSDCRWHQGSLQLLPMGERWMWLVRFDGARDKGTTPGSHKLTLIVLMNGKVVKPKIEGAAEQKPPISK